MERKEIEERVSDKFVMVEDGASNIEYLFKRNGNVVPLTERTLKIAIIDDVVDFISSLISEAERERVESILNTYGTLYCADVIVTKESDSHRLNEDNLSSKVEYRKVSDLIKDKYLSKIKEKGK